MKMKWYQMSHTQKMSVSKGQLVAYIDGLRGALFNLWADAKELAEKSDEKGRFIAKLASLVDEVI